MPEPQPPESRLRKDAEVSVQIGAVLRAARFEADEFGTPTHAPFSELISTAVRLVYRLEEPGEEFVEELERLNRRGPLIRGKPLELSYYIWLLCEMREFASSKSVPLGIREVASTAIGLLTLAMASNKRFGKRLDLKTIQWTATVRDLSKPVSEFLQLAEENLTDRDSAAERELRRVANAILIRARRAAGIVDHIAINASDLGVEGSEHWVLDADSDGNVTLRGPGGSRPTRLEIKASGSIKPYFNANSQYGWLLYSATKGRPSGELTRSSWSRAATAVAAASNGVLELSHSKDIGSFNVSVEVTKSFRSLAKSWPRSRERHQI